MKIFTIRTRDHSQEHQHLHFFHRHTLFLLPDFLAPDPCAEHMTTAIKNDQVRVRARAERTLPVCNAEAARRIERHTFYRFTQRTPREAREITDTGV